MATRQAQTVEATGGNTDHVRAVVIDTAPDHAEGHDGHDQVSVKRRMPDTMRKHLIRMQGGKLYLPAAYRIVWFRDECADWGVSTELVEGGHAAGFATVQATVYNSDGRVIASGLKSEAKRDFPAGWVEKAETGAIARALAVAGFGTQFSPELDDDAAHPADTPPSRRTAHQARPLNGTPRAPLDAWEGPGQCPRCHAPVGKRHGKPCTSATSEAASLPPGS